MKKITSIILFALTSLSLAACSGGQTTAETSAAEPAAAETQAESAPASSQGAESTQNAAPAATFSALKPPRNTLAPMMPSWNLPTRSSRTMQGPSWHRRLRTWKATM